VAGWNSGARVVGMGNLTNEEREELAELREKCVLLKRCSNSFLQLGLSVDSEKANRFWEILSRDKELMSIVDTEWETVHLENGRKNAIVEG